MLHFQIANKDISLRGRYKVKMGEVMRREIKINVEYISKSLKNSHK